MIYRSIVLVREIATHKCDIFSCISYRHVLESCFFFYLCIAYIKNVITKSIVQKRAIAGLIDVYALFRVEKHVYQKILPVLGPFNPQCIHADRENVTMEDLAVKGYINCERRNFLDLDHTVCALKVRIFQLII